MEKFGGLLAFVSLLGTAISRGAGVAGPKGYGGAKPVASNASEDGRAKNRRVEVRKV